MKSETQVEVEVASVERAFVSERDHILSHYWLLQFRTLLWVLDFEEHETQEQVNRLKSKKNSGTPISV